MDKTLGQIAFEAAAQGRLLVGCLWEKSLLHAEWELVAAAVAAAVKEEDARICDCYTLDDDGKNDDARRCAAAIRASIKGPK